MKNGRGCDLFPDGNHALNLLTRLDIFLAELRSNRRDGVLAKFAHFVQQVLIELRAGKRKQGDSGLGRDCFCNHGIGDPVGLTREICDRVVDVESGSRLKYMLDAYRYMPLLIPDAARINPFCA